LFSEEVIGKPITYFKGMTLRELKNVSACPCNRYKTQIDLTLRGDKEFLTTEDVSKGEPTILQVTKLQTVTTDSTLDEARENYKEFTNSPFKPLFTGKKSKITDRVSDELKKKLNKELHILDLNLLPKKIKQFVFGNPTASSEDLDAFVQELKFRDAATVVPNISKKNMEKIETTQGGKLDKIHIDVLERTPDLKNAILLLQNQKFTEFSVLPSASPSARWSYFAHGTEVSIDDIQACWTKLGLKDQASNGFIKFVSHGKIEELKKDIDSGVITKDNWTAINMKETSKPEVYIKKINNLHWDVPNGFNWVSQSKYFKKDKKKVTAHLLAWVLKKINSAKSAVQLKYINFLKDGKLFEDKAGKAGISKGRANPAPSGSNKSQKGQKKTYASATGAVKNNKSNAVATDPPSFQAMFKAWLLSG
jgi:hypothetical protein